MPRTKKTEPEAIAQPGAVNGPLPDVLTLVEAAAYLRLREQDVITAVSTEGLPGRLIAGEWRFLKSALQHWLSASQPTAEKRKAAQLAMVGTWKDDPHLEDMVEEIYRKRGRPITEDGSYRLFHGLNPEDLQK